MEVISSNKNQTIVQIKKLLDGKNTLLLEGSKIIAEAILSGITLNYLIVRDGEDITPFTADKTLIVTENVFKNLSDTVTPQGVLAVGEYEQKPLEKPLGNFLVLDTIQDPGNLGTLIRSASGTDFRDIFLINCANFTSSKVVRSSMGGLFRTNIFTFKTVQEFIDFAKKSNLNVAVCDMAGENLFDIKSKPKNLGIVVGNEGNGVSKELRDFAKTTIKIPMKNNLESLNAGVSGSIIMYYLDNLN